MLAFEPSKKAQKEGSNGYEEGKTRPYWYSGLQPIEKRDILGKRIVLSLDPFFNG